MHSTSGFYFIAAFDHYGPEKHKLTLFKHDKTFNSLSVEKEQDVFSIGSIFSFFYPFVVTADSPPNRRYLCNVETKSKMLLPSGSVLAETKDIVAVYVEVNGNAIREYEIFSPQALIADPATKPKTMRVNWYVNQVPFYQCWDTESQLLFTCDFSNLTVFDLKQDKVVNTIPWSCARFEILAGVLVGRKTVNGHATFCVLDIRTAHSSKPCIVEIEMTPDIESSNAQSDEGWWDVKYVDFSFKILAVAQVPPPKGTPNFPIFSKERTIHVFSLNTKKRLFRFTAENPLILPSAVYSSQNKTLSKKDLCK